MARAHGKDHTRRRKSISPHQRRCQRYPRQNSGQSRQSNRTAAAEPKSYKTIQEGLPSINQLRSTGQISVPNLRVDMHVYSGDATKRFVFINMSKYREGDRLAEGPIIEKITTEGVIMTHEGQRFRLDRD